MNRSFISGLASGAGLLALALLSIGAVSAGALSGLSRRAAPNEPEAALGAGFTYQGRLIRNSAAFTANCSMAFRLFDDASTGNQVGNPITTTVPVTQGLFTVSLDFGAGAFNGQARWLGIRSKCGSDAVFTDLTPRQQIAAAPYAVYSLTSGSTNALQGNPVSSASPGAGDLLQWNGSQWAAASLGRARRYYQTSATFAGNQALTACAAGYHMATLAEIFHTASLEYAASVPGAVQGADSGLGPPYSITGWIRTGVGSGNNNQVGAGNCSAWTSNSNAHYGTTVGLNPDWLSAVTNISPWAGVTFTCNSTRRVWCVED